MEVKCHLTGFGVFIHILDLKFRCNRKEVSDSSTLDDKGTLLLYFYRCKRECGSGPQKENLVTNKKNDTSSQIFYSA